MCHTVKPHKEVGYMSVHKGGAQNVTFYYTSVVVLKL